MAVASLVSIIASFVIFGGIMAFSMLFVNRRFWSTFQASNLLGTNPNRADLFFAQGTALAVRSFPWIFAAAMIAAIVLYFSDRHLPAAIIAWLPLINLVIPFLLFIVKIIGSRL